MKHWADREARRIEKARTLLRPGVSGQRGVWADLGCGNGIFTAALYTLLEGGSTIHTVDRDARALGELVRNFQQSYPAAKVIPLPADFRQPLPLPPLDGLVMANALHFYREKSGGLRHLRDTLKPGAPLILVEYNTRRGNLAVPHPVDAEGFLTLAVEAGFTDARILSRIPSSFLGEMYAGACRSPQVADLGLSVPDRDHS